MIGTMPSHFRVESKLGGGVTHNNIAAVCDIGEADGHLFLAMELVPGETLRVRMAPGLTNAEARARSKALTCPAE